ncbi:MAG: glycerate kinase, partial [Candidatus Brocadiia bacterium]
IGIGGSATNDCGCGMAQALGVKFTKNNGGEITEPMTGGLIAAVKAIDIGSLDERLSRCRFTVACDVRNPLLGPDGASRTYGPQKGADPEKVDILEANMRHIIGLIETAAGRSVRDIPGAGAAGGLGAGLMAFLAAKPESGIEIVMRYCRFAEKIRGADLIITGEGRIDATSACGKTISGIAAVARKESVPVIAVAGILGQGAEKLLEIGVEKIIVIERGSLSQEQGMLQAERLLAETIEKAFRDGDIYRKSPKGWANS